MLLCPRWVKDEFAIKWQQSVVQDPTMSVMYYLKSDDRHIIPVEIKKGHIIFFCGSTKHPRFGQEKHTGILSL